jgi:hypothetical protein
MAIPQTEEYKKLQESRLRRYRVLETFLKELGLTYLVEGPLSLRVKFTDVDRGVRENLIGQAVDLGFTPDFNTMYGDGLYWVRFWLPSTQEEQQDWEYKYDFMKWLASNTLSAKEAREYARQLNDYADKNS